MREQVGRAASAGAGLPLPGSRARPNRAAGLPKMWVWGVSLFCGFLCTLVWVAYAVPVVDIPFSPYSDDLTIFQMAEIFVKTELRKKRAATAKEVCKDTTKHGAINLTGTGYDAGEGVDSGP